MNSYVARYYYIKVWLLGVQVKGTSVNEYDMSSIRSQDMT